MVPEIPKVVIELARAPWSPGSSSRVITHKHGKWLQLRPGASTPPDVYLIAAQQTLVRTFRYGAEPSRN